MSRSAQSLKTELAKIRAELELLREARTPPRQWLEVIVGVDENKDGEIAQILAAGHNVIVHTVKFPPPIVMDKDEMTPELKLIADETAARRAKEAEEFKARSKTPPRRIVPPEERPTPIEYPKQVF